MKQVRASFNQEVVYYDVAQSETVMLRVGQARVMNKDIFDTYAHLAVSCEEIVETPAASEEPLEVKQEEPVVEKE